MGTSAVKSNLRAFSLVFTHEGRLLFADGTLWLVSAVFLSLVVYGLYNGMTETTLRDSAVTGLVKEQQESEASRLAQLSRIMAGGEAPQPFANPADPSSMGGGFGARYAVMPSAPLSPLAFGQSDLLPTYYQVTNRSKVTFIYDTEIENPWHLLSGHFDVSFVLIYLYPLLTFALSYNLLSAEREQGTLRMLLSQPLPLPVLVLGKVAVRASAILICAVVIPSVVLLVARPETHGGSQIAALGSWVALVAAYGMCWFALAVLVNTLGRSSAANALMMIGSWVVLVLVAPVLLNLLVSAARPAPSRTELATRTRLATIDGLRRYADLMSADYEYTDRPELLLPKDGKIDVPGRLRGFVLVDKHLDDELETLLNQFEIQLASQQTLIGRYGMASPAIVAYEGMTALAGNGSRRYLHFRRQVDAFHQSWKEFFEPRILSGTAITEADFDRMPRFVWLEEADGIVREDAMKGLVQLIVPVAVLALFGARRLRRYSAV